MKLPIVFIGEDSLEFAALYRQIEKESEFTLAIWARTFAEGSDYLRGTTYPTLVLVDLGWSPEKTLPAAEEIKAKHSHVRLIMTSPKNDPQTILGAMRSGAEEFFTQPFQWGDILESLTRLSQKIDVEIAKSMKSAKRIAVFSSKGGAGCTTVAINLAVTLASHKQKSVCLVDMAGAAGSVSHFLTFRSVDISSTKANDPQQRDGTLRHNEFLTHSSGVRLLPCTDAAGNGSKTDSKCFEGTIESVLQSFDYVVADSRKELDDNGLIALEQAHLVLVVTEMDVPSLKSAQRVFDAFGRLGLNDKKVRLLLNRHLKSKVMTIESAEQALGMKVFWTIPNDYPTALAALTQTAPIIETAKDSAIAKSYYKLADMVADCLCPSSQSNPDKKERKQSLFSRWMSAPAS